MENTILVDKSNNQFIYYLLSQLIAPLTAIILLVIGRYLNLDEWKFGAFSVVVLYGIGLIINIVWAFKFEIKSLRILAIPLGIIIQIVLAYIIMEIIFGKFLLSL